jgi:peptidoglycan/xylan/chitin deacetylase (PgdA/CDA1 family)
MKRLAFACAVLVALGAAAPAPREVCVTFDDLPIGGVLRHDITSSRAITSKLLATIGAHQIPAIGFVNEGKLGGPRGVDPARTALLRMWLDAGLELGNHTFSHLDLHTHSLDEFEADVVQGEAATRDLLRERGKALRFFRHPFLHTGRTLDVKQGLETFLASRGYRIAPVTIDNDEYIFAAAYDRASARRDRGMMTRVAEAYVPYMEAKFAFFERNATDLFGREIPQILLLHANLLNADRFDALARTIEGRGYRFVSLDRALEDPAYRSADTFTGAGGITWLHRWALTKGVPREFFSGEPDVPAFVAKAAQP